MADNFQQVMLAHLGPVLFRVAWWAHLDPSRRDGFADDLLDVIVNGIFDTFDEDQGTQLPPMARELARPQIKSMIDGQVGGFARQVSDFRDGTYVNLVMRVVGERDSSPVNRLLAEQYEAFASRIANLSGSLISAVKLINEEFIIWLKTHPQDTGRIHSDAFEQICGEILTSHGFSVEFTGRLKNVSADLIAVRANESGQDIKYLIECKRYSERNVVGLDIVNAVIGASWRARTTHAMLVTTSTFSANAISEQSRLGEFRLELHDGQKVTEWLRDYNFTDRYGLWLPKGWEDKWR